MCRHSLVARTFLHVARAQSHVHIFMCHTHTHGSSVCVKVFAHVSHLSISPSAVSCLTRLLLSPYDDSLSRLSRPHVLAVFTCPKCAGDADLRTRTRSLAIWPSPPSTQVTSPRRSTRSIVDNDTMLIDDPDHNFPDFSKNTNENKGLSGVPTVFESCVSHVSHDDAALQIESRESTQSGNCCLTEGEREKGKRRFVVSAAESSQRKVNGTASV